MHSVFTSFDSLSTFKNRRLDVPPTPKKKKSRFLVDLGKSEFLSTASSKIYHTAMVWSQRQEPLQTGHTDPTDPVRLLVDLVPLTASLLVFRAPKAFGSAASDLQGSRQLSYCLYCFANSLSPTHPSVRPSVCPPFLQSTYPSTHLPSIILPIAVSIDVIHIYHQTLKLRKCKDGGKDHPGVLPSIGNHCKHFVASQVHMHVLQKRKWYATERIIELALFN